MREKKGCRRESYPLLFRYLILDGDPGKGKTPIFFEYL